MRKILLTALGLALGWNLRAQVTVEVLMDQEQFLAGETMYAAVRIVNHSGQTLHLGEDADWLVFSMESKDGLAVSKNGEVPVKGAFDLESSKYAIKRVDLAPYFNPAKPGHYEVSAALRIKNWDAQLASPGRGFDIIEGSRLWEQAFGMPSTNTAESPEMRKYILQQANYLRTQIRLYLRLTDESEAHVLRVLAIGPMISLSRPDPQVDKQNNLHILYQDGPRSFNYTEVNPNGEIIARQTYQILNTRPRLKINDEGQIVVTGGVRVPTLNDIPASNNPADPAPSSPPAPAAPPPAVTKP